MKKRTRKIIKSAYSGKFVSKKYAKKQPRKTFTQTIKTSKKKK